MARIQYSYPTEQDMFELAANMRQSDLEELCAVTDASPLAAVRLSVEASDKEYLFAARSNGQLLCIGGACASEYQHIGIPWLLATQALPKYKKTLTREVRRCLPLMLQRWPVLTNIIDSRSQQTIKWLQALGFRIEERYEIKTGLPVFRFEMRVDHG